MVHSNAENLRDREDVYQWYTAEIASIPPVMQEVLEKYSGIPYERVIPHLSELVRSPISQSLCATHLLYFNSSPAPTTPPPPGPTLHNLQLTQDRPSPARPRLPPLALPLHRPTPLPEPEPQHAPPLPDHPVSPDHAVPHPPRRRLLLRARAAQARLRRRPTRRPIRARP